MFNLLLLLYFEDPQSRLQCSFL